MASRNATVASAVCALQCCGEQVGYRFRKMQTDNGSEFRAEFEEKYGEWRKQQYLIPVKSPKWGSKMEGTFKYLDDALLWGNNTIVPTVSSLQAELDAFVKRYNNEPNLGLRYIRPVSGRKRYTSNEVHYNALLSNSA